MRSLVDQDVVDTTDKKLLPPTRLAKAYWESDNQGVHERVNFDDTIWGFDLAGGAIYNTPIRVTKVKLESRAQKAGIRIGDTLLKINDIPTETLSLREAHDIIVQSGIHLKLNVTAPEDTETTYHCWEDPYVVEEKHKIEPEQKVKKKYRKIVCKTNSNWSLQWPWNTKPLPIYHESNCHLVPSRYLAKFGHKLLPLPENKPISLKPIKMQSNRKETGVEEAEEVEWANVNED